MDLAVRWFGRFAADCSTAGPLDCFPCVSTMFLVDSQLFRPVRHPHYGEPDFRVVSDFLPSKQSKASKEVTLVEKNGRKSTKNRKKKIFVSLSRILPRKFWATFFSIFPTRKSIFSHFSVRNPPVQAPVRGAARRPWAQGLRENPTPRGQKSQKMAFSKSDC